MLITNSTATDDAIETSWRSIETMTRGMREAANAANWGDVLDQATTRHQQILMHFNVFPIGPGNADFYRVHLNDILKGEQELQNLVRDARKSAMREGLSLKHNYAAV